MAGIFARLFGIGQSKAEAVADKLEDPILAIEQGIRDLKKDLETAMTSLAEVKALAIRARKQASEATRRSFDREFQAMSLLKAAGRNETARAEAERQAMEALQQKEAEEQSAAQLLEDHQKYEDMAQKLQAKVTRLKKAVTSYENELVTLKARAKTASSMKKINEQLARMDASGTINMLERMKQKVSEEESLAEAFGEIEEDMRSFDERIEQALAQRKGGGASASLEDMKKRMGLPPGKKP